MKRKQTKKGAPRKGRPGWKANTMALVWYEKDGTRHVEITKTKPGRWMSPEEHDKYIEEIRRKYGPRKSSKRGKKAA